MSAYSQHEFPFPPYEQPFTRNDLLLQKFAEKSGIKRLSITAGGCVVIYVALQYMFAIGLNVLGLYETYLSDKLFAGILDTVSYVLCTFVPFALAFFIMRPDERESAAKFGAPVSKAMLPIAIVIGMLACTIGDFSTSFITSTIEGLGFKLSGGDGTAINDIPSLVLGIINIALLPAFIEEFSLRCVIMQPLRRYGDTFAIVMSSLVFALMHGNMIQIPFAFIVGMAIGYLVISTGTVWTGIIIHFLNNFWSVFITYLLAVRPTLADRVYKAVIISVLVFGSISVAVYVFGKKDRLQKGSPFISTAEKATAYIFTLPMLVAIIILILGTSNYVKYVG